MRNRTRICAVLGVLVGLNVLFVVAILWAYGVLLPGVVAGTIVFARHGTVSFDLLQLPVSWQTVAVLVAGFLGAQLYYGYKRVLAHTQRGREDADHAVAGIVRRLAMTADIPEPGVRVVDDDEPSCYTVGRFTDATIVVTTGLIERLDADELAAVLAHEVAHVGNRDVTLMTVTTLFLEIAERAYRAARLARRAIQSPGDVSVRGKVALYWFLPLVALTYVFVAPILWLFPTVADWATRTLSHAREYAADAAAAHITGRPLALATALSSLTESGHHTPEKDLRTTTMQALSIVPSPLIDSRVVRSVPTPARPPGDHERRDRLRAWLDGETPGVETAGEQRSGATGHTHPPVGERIRRLQQLAAAAERDGGTAEREGKR
ncbi:Zn-dependent protease with chaperone function [Halorhabdus sp. SVX81]|uniref:M48 family metallopeptidase n=1 Tax=Halorhabdus sp. SVX81 TaxID=2978283 RepID=UPI0023DAF3D7|nr:M48 family metalloprotease [Halorhabdus sp. SVX81]WEL18706.1 Zn-dependent protease with chaperone function [Halorhabdus sp. SVX81]